MKEGGRRRGGGWKSEKKEVGGGGAGGGEWKGRGSGERGKAGKKVERVIKLPLCTN